MDLGKGMGPGANQDKPAILAFQMATLIICPACETRYETEAVFPPRAARCAAPNAACLAGHGRGRSRQPAVIAATPPGLCGRRLPPGARRCRSRPRRHRRGPVRQCRRCGGFAGIAPSPARSAAFPAAADERGRACRQVARINAEAMAEAAGRRRPEKRGGIFRGSRGSGSRCRRLRPCRQTDRHGRSHSSPMPIAP